MRVGILGYGRAGSTHFDACEAAADVTVAAVFDPAPAARQAARERGARAYANAGALLHDEALDAVIIAAPPADHLPLALQALRAGLPVLSEKPLATSAAAAANLFDAAGQKGQLLQVASKFRHVPEVIALRQQIGDGMLGDIVHFEIGFCSFVNMTGRWNAVPSRAGGGVIIDNGCHAFDVINFLLGSLDGVHATALARAQAVAVEDSASLLVRTAGGVVGNVLLSWSWGIDRDVYLTVRGTGGTVEVGWRGTRMKLAGQDWTAVGGAYSKLDAHRRMLEAFRDAVRGAAPAWIKPGDCLNVTGSVDAAYASLRSGRWQPVLTDGTTSAEPEEPQFGRLQAGARRSI